MLHFFTDPYREELISSMCARYHYYSGNINNQHTLLELFGRDNVTAFKMFPARLSYLEKQLNNKSYTCDYFIYRHTIFPFYSSFISKSKQLKVINLMKFEGNSLIYNILGISTSQINTRVGYMYCPECIKDNIKNFGEAYFYRVHQLQGVLVCPEHGCLLEEYNSGIESKCKFIRLNISKVNFKQLMFYKGDIHKELLMIAKAADYILTLPYLKYDNEDVRHRFKYFLNKKDYITHGNVVRQGKLLKDFKNYFNPEVLELLNSKIKNPKANWIRDITHNMNKIVSPIRNILLIIFLTENNVKMFFEIKIHNNPFGEGPWPCLNVAAEHYLEKVINKCEVENAYRSTVPKGIFKCTCGYVYCRNGPDKNEQDIFRVDKVLERGEKWEIKFKKCLEDSNYNISYTSKAMQCSQYKIRKYMKNNGFTEQIRLGEDKRKDKFIEYSNDIINYMKLIPNCTKTNIHVNLSKQVSWFRRNNPEWLNEKLSICKKKQKAVKHKIDYNKLDIKILNCVKRAYNELILLEKPVRITGWVIEKHLNLYIMKRIKKLPKTKEYLDEIIETFEEFRIRRCKNIINDKLRNGGNI